MHIRMSVITATFFTIVGLLVLSHDIEINSVAVGVMLLTIAVLSWYAYLSELRTYRTEMKRAQEWWAKEKQQTENQQLFDQNATQEYNPFN